MYWKAAIQLSISEAVKQDVAIELNSHFIIDTDIAMLHEAIEQNAKVAFSTDAHRQDEIADFSYHNTLLEQANIKLEDLNIFDACAE